MKVQKKVYSNSIAIKNVCEHKYVLRTKMDTDRKYFISKCAKCKGYQVTSLQEIDDLIMADTLV